MMWLVRRFVPNYSQVGNQRVRESYGKLAGIVGITANFLLSCLKFIAGGLSGSVSVTADAANNLSDAASSVITILSFRLAGKPADAEHPFGHSRIEYISSILVSFIIFFLAIGLLRSSLDKILHPALPAFSLLTVAALLVSMGVKFWMFFFNKNLGRTIDSSVMAAAAADSLSDVYASSAVLVSHVLGAWLRIPLDGYIGLLVVAFIVKAGISVLHEVLDKLLGSAPPQEMTDLISQHILGHEGVYGIHDLVLHSYGPNRHFATVHVEVDAGEDLLKSHDMIDTIEREMAVDHGIHLVIHLDPIVRDERTRENTERVRRVLECIDPSLSMHDFRMVEGPTHTNLIFDVSVPPELRLARAELQKRIIHEVRALDSRFYAVVTLDSGYTGMPSNKVH